MPTDEDDQDGHFFYNHPEREGLLRCLSTRSLRWCCLDPILPLKGGEGRQKRAQRTARSFCAASPAISHVRSANTAAAVGAAFTTHVNSFPSRLVLVAAQHQGSLGLGENGKMISHSGACP